MDVLKKYSIAFKGLGEGTHRFDMKVDDRFFEAFEGSEIRRGNADVRLTLDKRGNGMALDFDIRGEVAVECDRCLEEFMMPVRYEGTLHVRYSDCERESDGEVMWISPSETELNVAQYIYESIVLSLPYQRVHPDGACNPEMLERFRIVSDQEFASIEARAGGGKEHNEGEWAKLAALREQMEAEEEEPEKPRGTK